MEHWDAFAEEGLRKPVRGLKFHIDTGEHKTICHKQREYGAHESRVITKLCEEMEKNGFIEDDDGRWTMELTCCTRAKTRSTTQALD